MDIVSNFSQKIIMSANSIQSMEKCSIDLLIAFGSNYDEELRSIERGTWQPVRTNNNNNNNKMLLECCNEFMFSFELKWIPFVPTFYILLWSNWDNWMDRFFPIIHIQNINWKQKQWKR